MDLKFYISIFMVTQCITITKGLRMVKKTYLRTLIILLVFSLAGFATTLSAKDISISKSKRSSKRSRMPKRQYNEQKDKQVYKMAFELLQDYKAQLKLTTDPEKIKTLNNKIKELEKLLGIKSEQPKQNKKTPTVSLSKPIDKDEKKSDPTKLGLYIGAKGGINLSSTSKSLQGETNSNLSFGAVVEYMLRSFDDFSIWAGVNLFYLSTSWENKVGKTTANYLHVPVMGILKYDTKTTFIPYFFAGGYFNYLTNASYDSKTENKTYGNFADFYVSSTVGLVLGLGCELDFDFGKPFIEFGYLFGLTPASRNVRLYREISGNNTLAISTDQSTNRNIIIYLGYKYEF